HDVRARVEVISPHVREQPLPAHDLTLVEDEVMEEPELAVRELRHQLAEPRLAPCEIERQLSRTNDALAAAVAPAVPQLRPHSGEQLVERERLRDVVGCAEAKAPELR